MKYYFLLANKKYPYELTLNKDKQTTHIVCEAARVNQDFSNEDVPALIEDLPNIVMAKASLMKQRDKIMKFRVNDQEKQAVEKKAREKGFDNVSEYLRRLALS